MIVGIIPARYESSRFPGKPLIDIKGKTMIQRVVERAQQSKLLSDIVVATDDARIYDHVISLGAKAVMTSSDHQSGTDRCFEALCKFDQSYKYVINIQGDEPMLEPEQIDELANVLLVGEVELATQITSVDDAETLWSEGEVKVVLNDKGEALYFSRSVIPYIKNLPNEEWHQHHSFWRHVGMYAYRADVLEKLTKLPLASLEKAESLEQLRWLQAGFSIQCVPTKYNSYCVDTPDDLKALLPMIS
jgi:3-deoxy-manno-octulosonate cytidylyltransferase (CMP-KDO synthetase)